MDVYPFFLQCSKHETDDVRKHHLESLAFGHKGLVYTGASGLTLNTISGPYLIPDAYSDDEKDRLYAMLWKCADADEFMSMRDEMKLQRLRWTNVRKKDKLRQIDRYVLSHVQEWSERHRVKRVITVALILKVLRNTDIDYDNFDVQDINGEFDADYFQRLREEGDYTDDAATGADDDD